MRPLLLMLALSGAAGAVSVPFTQVLRGTPGVTRVTLADEWYRVTLQPRGSAPMSLKVQFGRNTAYPGMHFNLGVVSKGFTPAQLQGVQTLVNRVAVTCFNIRSERQADLSKWLSAQNQVPDVSGDTMFGPLHASFERGIQEDGNIWSSVHLHREQVPGVTPWINTCKP